MKANFKEWIKKAGVRAIKTFAQAMVSVVGIEGIGIGEVDWIKAASIAAMAAVLSLLTSVAGLPELDAGKTEE